MRARRGFTLIEVMVALAIAVPALIVLYRQTGVALDLTGSAMRYENATARAQSHLAALSASGVVTGDREGDDGGGFRWHTRVVPAATLPPGRFVRGSGATLFDVSVAISWQGGRGAQSVALATRLLGPPDSESP